MIAMCTNKNLLPPDRQPPFCPKDLAARGARGSYRGEIRILYTEGVRIPPPIRTRMPQ